MNLLNDLDIDESVATSSVNGHGLKNDKQSFGDYTQAQIPLIRAFLLLHQREPTTEESLYLARGFAYIAKGLIDLIPNKDEGQPATEVIHVRAGINLVFDRPNNPS